MTGPSAYEQRNDQGDTARCRAIVILLHAAYLSVRMCVSDVSVHVYAECVRFLHMCAECNVCVTCVALCVCLSACACVRGALDYERRLG